MLRHSITIAILTGGASRRMGSDKRLMIYRGGTMLEGVVNAAVRIGCKVVTVGGGTSSGGLITGVGHITDDHPGGGPLAALATSLRHASGPILLLPCDVPLLQSDGIMWLVTEWERRESAAPGVCRGLVTQAVEPSVEPSAGQSLGQSSVRLEPMFAIYAQPLLPAIDRLVSEGERRLRSVADLPGVELIDLPDWVARQLHNVNTPDDFRALP